MSSTPPHTLFVSDLHLESGRPDITACFLAFLEGPARGAEALYILGDLFEVWIGDDAPGATGSRVAASLHELAGAGVDIHFLAGNRDFLIGEDYCRLAGMRRIEEPVVVDMYGVPTLLLHGDALCTHDDAYQRMRAKTRDPQWQQRMLSRPRWCRHMLARTARLASRVRGRFAPAANLDVNPGAVADAFLIHGVDRMIHGHTHRPGIHRHEIDGRSRERIVLGDWFEQGSVLRLSANSVDLQDLPFNRQD